MALRGIRRFMPTWRMVRSMSSQQKDSGNLTKHIQDMLKTLKQRTQKGIVDLMPSLQEHN